MIKSRYSLALGVLALGMTAAAQDLNTEITVNHEVVPEEQAATRLRIMPQISLPKVDVGRLPAVAHYLPAQLSPFISPLGPASYLDQNVRYAYRGYAMLGYGPVYNLTGSVGYRCVESDRLTVDAYGQFNGISYTRNYRKLPAFMDGFDGKACFRRQSAALGANTRWTTGKGTLTGSVLYDYIGYNYPILQLQMPPVTDKHIIDANLANVNVGWSAAQSGFDYSVGVDYSTIYMGKNNANNNRIALNGATTWYTSSKSAVNLELGFSMDHSSLTHNKGILHVLPRYSFAVSKFRLRLGANVDVRAGNVAFGPQVLIAPDIDVVWQPSTFFNIWGKVNGKIDDNYRGKLLDEQPYLLADFDAGMSRIYNGDAGLTFGPLRGAAVQVFCGYTIAKDWYMPAIETGYMTPIDVKGFHWGAAFSYDWRRYVSTSIRLDMAQSPRGDYGKGYAPWRDHAKLNLVYNLIVRPIDKLDIGVGYHLRAGRQKTLGEGKDLNLCNISNLSASVSYRITPQWSAFVRGENLLNQNWYLGPAVPCQGIMGMVGASYKF